MLYRKSKFNLTIFKVVSFLKKNTGYPVLEEAAEPAEMVYFYNTLLETLQHLLSNT